MDPRKINIKVDDGALVPFEPSPRNRVITENELLGVITGRNSEDVSKLKKLAFGNVLNSKNYVK